MQRHRTMRRKNNLARYNRAMARYKEFESAHQPSGAPRDQWLQWRQWVEDWTMYITVFRDEEIERIETNRRSKLNERKPKRRGGGHTRAR